MTHNDVLSFEILAALAWGIYGYCRWLGAIRVHARIKPVPKRTAERVSLAISTTLVGVLCVVLGVLLTLIDWYGRKRKVA